MSFYETTIAKLQSWVRRLARFSLLSALVKVDRSRRIGIVSLLSALIVLVCISLPWHSPKVQARASSEPVYPEKTWQVVKPADEGMEVVQLHELSGFLGGSGCVTRHGRMIYTWGSYKGLTDMASASKPLMTLLLLEAMKAGKLSSLDARVAELEPALNSLNAALGHKDRAITWRHLLTQTSCYGVTEAPGTAFDYNDFQSALLFDTLIEKVYGVAAEDATLRVLRPSLDEPLQCEDQPAFSEPGANLPTGRLKISLRDFCRIGLLMMRNGQWQGRTLMDTAALHHALTVTLPVDLPRTAGAPADMLPNQRSLGGARNQEDHLGAYSSMWWVNGTGPTGERFWPDAPADAFGAFGFGGSRALVVMPSQGIVASWTRTKLPKERVSGKGRENMNHCFRLLLSSVINKPLLSPTNVAGKN